MSATSIVEIRAREIIDSRGNPTIEVDVQLSGGALGRAAVPSGASTGVHEALELRDGDPRASAARACPRPSPTSTADRRTRLRDADAAEQTALDERLIALDGTENKSKLGANAMLGVSLAAAHAAAAAGNLPLYRYLNPSASVMPVPMMNVINGGKHADSSVDMQEFMIVPLGAPSIRRGDSRWAPRYFTRWRRAQEARTIDQRRRRRRLRSQPEQQRGADRSDPRSHRAGRVSPGDQVAIALDPASSEFYEDGGYVFARSDKPSARSEQMVRLLARLDRRIPDRLDRGWAGRGDWAG